jgi:hypothetical protein
VQRAYLLLVGLTFCAFGFWFLVRPDALEGFVGVRAESADARTELRAFYGGLEIGIGAFLCGCALRRRHLDTGLWATAWLLGCTGLARLAGILMHGSDGWDMPAFAAAEILAAAAALALVGRQEPTAT